MHDPFLLPREIFNSAKIGLDVFLLFHKGATVFSIGWCQAKCRCSISYHTEGNTTEEE